MNSEINAFINKYVKEIRNNNAAFFAGAGFSKESGYVDWKTLLESIASELGLECIFHLSSALFPGIQST